MSVAWAIGAWATNSWVGMNAGPPNAWRGDSTPPPPVIVVDTHDGGRKKRDDARRQDREELRSIIREAFDGPRRADIIDAVAAHQHEIPVPGTSLPTLFEDGSQQYIDVDAVYQDTEAMALISKIVADTRQAQALKWESEDEEDLIRLLSYL